MQAENKSNSKSRRVKFRHEPHSLLQDEKTHRLFTLLFSSRRFYPPAHRPTAAVKRSHARKRMTPEQRSVQAQYLYSRARQAQLHVAAAAAAAHPHARAQAAQQQQSGLSAHSAQQEPAPLAQLPVSTVAPSSTPTPLAAARTASPLAATPAPAPSTETDDEREKGFPMLIASMSGATQVRCRGVAVSAALVDIFVRTPLDFWRDNAVDREAMMQRLFEATSKREAGGKADAESEREAMRQCLFEAISDREADDGEVTPGELHALSEMLEADDRRV